MKYYLWNALELCATWALDCTGLLGMTTSGQASIKPKAYYEDILILHILSITRPHTAYHQNVRKQLHK